VDTGVYRVVNTVTDTTYIGSAVNIQRRLEDHRARLNRGKHANRHLQRSWDKHGEAAFVFESLVECSVETRKDREQRFIDAYIDHGMKIYNQRPSGPGSVEWLGRTHTDESKAKISAANKGRVRSEEDCSRSRATALAMMADPERKARNTKRLRMNWHDPEIRAKMVAGMRGVLRSDETKKRMSVAKSGRVLSEETRRRIGVAHKGWVPSATTRERMRLGQIRRHIVNN